MHLRRSECQRQKIKDGKRHDTEYEIPMVGAAGTDQGQIGAVTGLFFVLFLAVFLSAQLQLEMVRTSSAALEDALAASGLASALADIRRYGSSHEVAIEDCRRAYEKYCDTLVVNLGLNEEWEGCNDRLITGRVQVTEYVVYNVTGNRVEIWEKRGEGFHCSDDRLGNVYTPGGQLVERTGIYSEISYPFRGIFGLETQARKGKLVEIVSKISERREGF